MASREREREDGREVERSARRRYREMTPISRERYEEATEYMPGGNTRGVLYYEPYPAYIENADGARLRDVDGNEYLDFLNNYTSLIHGHTPEEPVERAVDAARRGSAPGGPTPVEIEWAAHLVERAPAVERIRFANSGTEATMNAIRAARAYTGRDVVAKFEGAYHGTHDDALVSIHPPSHLAGPAGDPNSVPDSAGIPDSVTDNVLTLPYNDADAALEKLERHRSELAGVLFDPLVGSSVIPAEEPFAEAIDGFTSEADVPLICDEVISFRVAHGGVHADYGIEPDLVTYGKVVGGGFPVGAFGGRAEVMAGYDPRGGSDIVHSGTFNGNPVTASAGLATLDAYDEGEVERLNGLCERLVESSRAAAEDLGYDVRINQYGSLFNVYLTDEAVTDHRTAAASHQGLEGEVFLELLTRGVRLAPKLMGCLSTPMGEDEVGTFVSSFRAALDRLRPEFEDRAPHLLA